jgi:serine/threonine-protein kinase
MSVAIGSRFDRYEILAPLGAGGMGEVYLARDSRLERKIAIKLLPAEFTRDPARLQRFVTEAKTASALNHPNIITIHEIGEASDQQGARHFITTEFVEGQTLRQLIPGGGLGAMRTLDLAVQIASALAAAHQAGIIHRDIKPENVMVRPDGIVKVLDFGLAKLTERVRPETESDAPTQALLDTDPGTVLGTATYMSPEQARGLRVDARTDIFSLGVVLYEMVTGHAPFEGQTPADVMSQVLNREPRLLSSRAGGVPAELQRIVSKALRKDREERYQTVKDLLLDLKSLKREMEATSAHAFSGAPTVQLGAGKAVSYETVVIPNTAPVDTIQTGPVSALLDSRAETVSRIKHNKRGVLFSAAALALVVAAIFLFNLVGHNDDVIDSIAVLPFAHRDTSDDAQLLSDAITDSIINNLSKLPSLNVKPRAAVRPFKGREAEVKAIAKQLDVHAVLTGEIVQRDGNLSISIALVDALDNRNLWGQRYERKISDLLLIQQEIARDVSDNLRLKLTGEQQKRQDAYQLYVKGRNAWSKRTAEGIEEGIKHFEQATRVDPSYAPAYAGLADSYNMLVNYSILPGKETFPKARDAAEKAIALDESLAEAHAALAFTRFQWEWDWAEAERGYRRAIDLKPDYGAAHQWYSSLLAVTGQTERALAEAKRARELEPFSLIVSSHYGWINYLARRYDQTIQESRQILKLDPNFFAAHRYQALAYEAQDKSDDALSAFQKALPMSRGSVLLKAELGHAYAVAGKRKEAMQALDELRQLAAQRPISPFHLALVHLGLGEKDRALELLYKALDERAERLVWLRVDPRFDPLRADARFNNLLERIGLAR